MLGCWEADPGWELAFDLALFVYVVRALETALRVGRILLELVLAGKQTGKLLIQTRTVELLLCTVY